ncbi:MAG: galactokinase [Anaerolineales bacterium]
MQPGDLVLRFEQIFDQTPTLVARGPGRVNLLGEHVDYNGGLALPCAIDRSALLAAAPRTDRIVDLIAVDFDERCRFHLDHLDAKVSLDGSPLPQWARYPAGVAWSLSLTGLTLSGFEGVLTSDVPNGAGLSSSAAIETCLAIAWLALDQERMEPLPLAQVCQRAENEYVGLASGLMDQWTSLAGRAGHALELDFAGLSAELVPLPTAFTIIVADSRERRALDDSAYNTRVRECQQAAQLLSERIGGSGPLGALDPAQFEQVAASLPDLLRRRARHVVTEVDRVRQAVQALRTGEAERLGELMLAGHLSLRDDFEVSTPRLDQLVEAAVSLPGCHGARLTGAGFGGCTVNWVETGAANEFVGQLTDRYRRNTGVEPRVWISRASDGAQLLSHGSL